MDKYIIVKKIGEGSFGKAILVKSKDSGEQFVVKEIGISKMKPKEKSEARKEVTVLSKMRHPNIVQYTESFEENGYLYIVMEYCEGGDLYALINKQKGVPFSEQQVLNWFVQLCLALKHVHDRKILHRDIKTSNIFLTKSGTIKLGDFGIARVLNNTMELARTCIGTPYYLSPEICENKPYNNKSDVWALGCVVYEALTLKHAFEAGNMKNLVLKIIRGSYPPVPSRYSYDLRTLVSQLFRRNPRERPSINSILRKPFLSGLTEQFLSPEQHEEEFSHTVLHKGRPPRPSSSKPPAYGGRYQSFAGKRPQNLEVRGGAVGVRNRRDHQIAAVYGPSVAAKKPKSAVSRPPKNEDYLEKRRQQLVEQERRRKEALAEEKKKRLEDLQKRQRERAFRLKEDQLRRARDEARDMNLKRSAEILEPRNNAEAAGNMQPKPFANAGRDRPVSAPQERGDYEKYHQYLNKLEKGDRLGAAELAAPGLDRVKQAWEERQRGQEAILAARVNKVAAVQAAERAEVVREFLLRKNEARLNKQKDMRAKENKVGVSAALRPYSAARAKDVEEQNYLSKLKQIRQQNYQERKILHKKFENQKKAYKVEIPASSDVSVDEELRKKKVEALKQQAAERAKVLQENMEKRRMELDAQQDMKVHDAKARARGIIPPDERPVKYNPTPISVTQALHAVGAPVQKQEEKSVNEMLSPSRANPHLRKKILRRVNERFSVDYEEEQKKEEEEEKNEAEKPDNSETVPRPLPECPEEPKEEPRKESAWQARKNDDIVNQISGLPLQDTKSLLEGTNVPVPAHPSVPKRQWQAPSNTFVRQLNQMTLLGTTATMPVDAEKGSDDKATSFTVASPEKPYSPSEESKTASTSDQSSEKSSEKTRLTVDDKTIVIRNNPIADSASSRSGKQTFEKKLAVNFRPVKPMGTYVIKSLDADAQLSSDKEISPVKVTTDSPQKSETSTKSSREVKTSVANAEDKKVEIKTGSPVKQLDVADDIEELELENELKSQLKTSEWQSAWTEESQNQSQSLINKPPLLPKPMQYKPPIAPKSPAKLSGLSSSNDISKSSEESKTEESGTGQSLPPPVPSRPTVCESPLFTRVNKTKSGSVATTPNPKIDRLEQSDPPSSLSKTLYSTANDQMLMKITLGHFDSPNPKLLRTCSLPDLNLAPDESGYEKEDSQSKDEKTVKEVSVMSSMNDTNFDDDEDVTLRSVSDPETDEEELDDLRANLQSVLMNSSKPDSTLPISSNLSTSITINGGNDDTSSSNEGEDQPQLNEDWQSDSDSSEDDDVSDTESIFSRMEDIREELERRLGLEKLKQVYRYVQASHEDEDEEVMQCQSRVRNVLGDKHDELYPKILQLVMADGAYCEDNA